MSARATQRGLPIVPVPGGGQPRAALGHLSFAMLGALETAGLLPRLASDVEATVASLERVAADLGPDVPTSANEAKQVAEWIGERVPVVWGADGIAAVASMRWKTQLNENGKVPAWHAAMSELDHNEVVGWLAPYGERHAIVTLRHDDEDDEIADGGCLIPKHGGAESKSEQTEEPQSYEETQRFPIGCVLCVSSCLCGQTLSKQRLRPVGESCGFLLNSGQAMELKARRLADFGIQFRFVKSPSFSNWMPASAGQRRTLNATPDAPCLLQGRAKPPDSMAHKPDRRHPRQEAAFPKNQPGVEMADDRLLELREASANSFFGPKEGQG